MPTFRTQWRTEIQVRIDGLQHRLRVAEVGPAPSVAAAVASEEVTTRTAAGELKVTIEEKLKPPPAQESVRRAHIDAAQQALASAEVAIVEGSLARRLRDWWAGTAVTAAWEYVHEAEAELVEIESEEDLKATLPALMTWMQDVMPPDGRRKGYEEQLGEFVKGKNVDRTVVRQTYRDVIVANNEKHSNIRELRNRILLATVALGIFLCGVGLWHALNPSFISLCRTVPAPAAASAGSTAGQSEGTEPAKPNESEPAQAESETICVSGESPKGRDIFEIELIGAIAGLLGLAFGLTSFKTPPSRYDPKVSQLLLKPVAGAATALLGVILVQAEIPIAPPSEASESVIFAYAAVFGFSQQLLTRMVDKRAATLLGEPEEEKKEG
jgi:hypothetical protein